MTAPVPPTSPAPGSRSTSVVVVAPGEVRLSPLNPRANTPHSPESIKELADEIAAVGQINNAHGERNADGEIELFAGSRRRAACALLGRDLRVQLHLNMPREEAIHIAYRDDRGAVPVSYFDTTAGWRRLIDDGIVANEAALAGLVGADKGTINRGMTFQAAPASILAPFGDPRTVTQAQWMDLAPLVANPDLLPRLLARAGLIVGKNYSASRVMSELKAAAANKEAIKREEVHDRHGSLIATITPGHRDDFTIKVRSMRTVHRDDRLARAKLINTAFLNCIKEWFGDDR